MTQIADGLLGAAIGFVLWAICWQIDADAALGASAIAFGLSLFFRSRPNRLLPALVPPRRESTPLETSVALPTIVPSAAIAARLPLCRLSRRKAPNMATIVQDLDILELVLGDIAAFAAGKPVTQSITEGGSTYSVTVQVLPSGPVAPFQTFSGGFLAILSMILVDFASFSAGQPIQIAEKIGATWYGTSVAVVAKSA